MNDGVAKKITGLFFMDIQSDGWPLCLGPIDDIDNVVYGWIMGNLDYER